MNKSLLGIVLSVFLAAMLLAGCSGGLHPVALGAGEIEAGNSDALGQAEDSTVGVVVTKTITGGNNDALGQAGDSRAEPGVSQSPSAEAPEAVVEGFYAWYLDYSGSQGNPLVSKAYRSSEYLTGEWIQQVDAIIDSFDKGGFDPFLCAQDLPNSVTVYPARFVEGTATVQVDTSFEGHSLMVTLEEVNGEWKINSIQPLPRGKMDAPATQTPPDHIVAAFYSWHVDYLAHRGNPLVDRPYRDSELVTQELVSKIDAIIDGFEMGGYDPILCAQDVPQIMSYRTVERGSEEATVAVRESWMGSFTDVLVTLVPTENSWLINDITCTQPDYDTFGTPAHIVEVLFNWYIEYAGRIGNPMIDGTYHNGSLSETFLRQVEDTIASFGAGPGFDPILLAQDVPAEFMVEEEHVTQSEATVLMHQLFSGAPRTLRVSLEKNMGRWEITDIAVADEPGRE